MPGLSCSPPVRPRMPCGWRSATNGKLRLAGVAVGGGHRQVRSAQPILDSFAPVLRELYADVKDIDETYPPLQYVADVAARRLNQLPQGRLNLEELRAMRPNGLTALRPHHQTSAQTARGIVALRQLVLKRAETAGISEQAAISAAVDDLARLGDAFSQLLIERLKPQPEPDELKPVTHRKRRRRDERQTPARTRATPRQLRSSRLQLRSGTALPRPQAPPRTPRRTPRAALSPRRTGPPRLSFAPSVGPEAEDRPFAPQKHRGDQRPWLMTVRSEQRNIIVRALLVLFQKIGLAKPLPPDELADLKEDTADTILSQLYHGNFLPIDPRIFTVDWMRHIQPHINRILLEKLGIKADTDLTPVLKRRLWRFDRAAEHIVFMVVRDQPEPKREDEDESTDPDKTDDDTDDEDLWNEYEKELQSRKQQQAARQNK
jgi:hypothetical protein